MGNHVGQSSECDRVYLVSPRDRHGALLNSLTIGWLLHRRRAIAVVAAPKLLKLSSP